MGLSTWTSSWPDRNLWQHDIHSLKGFRVGGQLKLRVGSLMLLGGWHFFRCKLLVLGIREPWFSRCRSTELKRLPKTTKSSRFISFLVVYKELGGTQKSDAFSRLVDINDSMTILQMGSQHPMNSVMGLWSDLTVNSLSVPIHGYVSKLGAWRSFF